MSNLREIKTESAQCREVIVADLEKLLERARAGDFRGLACAIVTTDHCLETFTTGALDFIEKLGAIEACKANIIRHAEER